MGMAEAPIQRYDAKCRPIVALPPERSRLVRVRPRRATIDPRRAPVAQRIECRPPEPKAEVRVLSGVFCPGPVLPGGHVQPSSDCAKGRVHLIQAGVMLDIEHAVDLWHVPAQAASELRFADALLTHALVEQHLDRR